MKRQFQNLLDVPRTIWVGGLEAWMDEAYLSAAFEQAGSVVNVKILRFQTTFGFVQFAHSGEVQNLLGRLGDDRIYVDMHGHRHRVSQALNTESREARGGRQPTDISLYVGNLDTAVNDQELLELFSKYSSSLSAKVILDSESGCSKGYGFIRLRSPADAEEALGEMDGKYLRSRPIKIRRSISSKPNYNAAGADGAAPIAAGIGAPAVGVLAPEFVAGVPPPPPPPSAVRPLGHVMVISGMGTGCQEADILSYLGHFGTMYRAQKLEEHGGMLVEFGERSAAEAAWQHLQKIGVSARLVSAEEAVAGWPIVARVTNMTSAHAATELQAQLHAHLQTLEQPSPEHFQALLQDQVFLQAFEHILAQREASAAAAKVSEWPWLLQDRPPLFQGKLCAKRMNADFLPPCGSPRFAARVAPALPSSMRLLF